VVLVAILIVGGILFSVLLVVARLLVVVVVVVVEVREDRVVVGFVVVKFVMQGVGMAGGIIANNSIIIISRVCFNFTRENVDKHELIMFFVVCSF
jgi:hypothetical protein